VPHRGPASPFLAGWGAGHGKDHRSASRLHAGVQALDVKGLAVLLAGQAQFFRAGEAQGVVIRHERGQGVHAHRGPGLEAI